MTPARAFFVWYGFLVAGGLAIGQLGKLLNWSLLLTALVALLFGVGVEMVRFGRPRVGRWRA